VLYARGMDERERLRKVIEEAERELAAKRSSEIRAAATKRRLALQGLRWPDEQERNAKRRPDLAAAAGRATLRHDLALFVTITSRSARPGRDAGRLLLLFEPACSRSV
jgi:hypothetical protein